MLIVLIGFSTGYSRKVADLKGLNLPRCIELDGDELYVLDEPEVKIYSIKDGKLLRRFGKMGSGPGELLPNDEIPLQMQLLEDQVFLNSQTKFIHYSKSGRILKEKPVSFMCMQIIPFGKGYAVSRVGFDEERHIFFRLIFFDSEFNEIKTVYTTEKNHTLQSSGKLNVPTGFLYMSRMEGKLYAFSGRQDDFRVHVFDSKGNALKAISMDYQLLEWTEKRKRSFYRWIETVPRFRNRSAMLKPLINFSQYIPPIRNILPRNGRVYVQTYGKKDNLSEFFIFTPAGERVKQVYLPESTIYPVKVNPDITFTIAGNTYYYLEENPESDIWELHTAQL